MNDFPSFYSFPPVWRTAVKLQCMCVRAKSLQSYQILCNPMDYSPPGSSVHRDCPGKNTGEGGQAFLQGVFPTQGSNPCLYVSCVGRHDDHQRHLGSPSTYPQIINLGCFQILIDCCCYSSLSPARLFTTLWTTPHQAPLFFTISQSLLRFMSLKLVMLSSSSFATLFCFCFQFPPPASEPNCFLIFLPLCNCEGIKDSFHTANTSPCVSTLCYTLRRSVWGHTK